MNVGRQVEVFFHRIHVWYIYLHLVDFHGKCRYLYHTWILSVLLSPGKWLDFVKFPSGVLPDIVDLTLSLKEAPK